MMIVHSRCRTQFELITCKLVYSAVSFFSGEAGRSEKAQIFYFPRMFCLMNPGAELAENSVMSILRATEREKGDRPPAPEVFAAAVCGKDCPHWTC